MPKGYTIHALTEDDIFDEGTVIRWVASGRFTYAALKTPPGGSPPLGLSLSLTSTFPRWSRTRT